MSANGERDASRAQRWALFCATKLDVREVALTYAQASDLLTRANKGSRNEVVAELSAMSGAVVKGKPGGNAAEWQALHERANAAGKAAAEAAVPVPMVVQQHADVTDDDSRVLKQWVVDDGVCGFAWVTIHPGNCSFALWLKKNHGAKKAYRGGMMIWISEYGQSMTRKHEYAKAYAQVIRDAGVDAYSGSRMD